MSTTKMGMAKLTRRVPKHDVVPIDNIQWTQEEFQQMAWRLGATFDEQQVRSGTNYALCLCDSGKVAEVYKNLDKNGDGHIDLKVTY